jgi:hypothetical protein
MASPSTCHVSYVFLTIVPSLDQLHARFVAVGEIGTGASHLSKSEIEARLRRLAQELKRQRAKIEVVPVRWTAWRPS